VTAVLTTIADSFTTTVFSAEDLNAEQVAKEWTVIATLGTFVVITLGVMMWVHYLDWKVKSSIQVADSSTLKVPMQEKRRTTKQSQSSKAIQAAVGKEVALIVDSLPSVLSYRTFMERFLAELRRHHRWFEVVCHFSASCPRSLRVLSLAVQVVSMLFVQSVIYNVTNPDDGSCSTYTSPSECQLPKSSFGTSGNKCQWSRAESSCSFVDPSEDITVVIFVAILSAALSTPIAIAEGIIIQRFLAATTLVPQDDSDEGNTKRKSFFFNEDEDAQRITVLAKASLAQLLSARMSYREKLTAVERKEFDGISGSVR